MIRIEDTVAVLLSAGFSERHPGGCKLMRAVRGRPLVQHAASLLAALPFKARIAVVPPLTEAGELHRLLTASGFQLVENERRDQGQDSSVRLGVLQARTMGAEAALFCLGDMPFITAAHLAALQAAASCDRPAVSQGEAWHSPPLLVPKHFFDLLADEGKRPKEILSKAQPVPIQVSAETLRDFDTPEDFERLGTASCSD